MEARLDIDSAGREFDQWLDWSGTVNTSSRLPLDGKTTIAPGQISRFPISPSSSSNGDVHLSHLKTDLLTAPSQHDLLTPRHSSGSPESRSSLDMRLSGDTLREIIPLIERPMLKRKLSPSDVPITDSRYDAPTPAAKKRPHNIIEKRYRANLNDKIAELRDSVPALRITKKSKAKDSGKEDSEEEDLDGLSPSNKLNKASILTKAVEYIRHLEFRTKRLEEENKSLKERLETLDKVIAQGGHDAQRAAAFTSNTIIEESPIDSHSASPSSAPKQTSSGPPQGLISLPESWRRLRQNQSQEHYGHIYDTPSNRSRLLKGKWPTRVMLGSLAGLMIIDGLHESDTGTESREKGLFGIPLELLDGWQFLQSPKVYLAAFSQFCQAGGVFPLVKGFVALTIVAFLVFSYLFNSKPGFKQDLEEAGPTSTQAPAPASPIEVRRRAWSTSMQELRLPHHSFFPEWLALTSEWLKYTVGCLFGPRAYAWLTGRTAEDDVARIKAWDIAIDAQLAGGDVEVSRSRVVLTIFGSGTLPSTPLRLMLKALHCRVLLWNVGSLGTAVSRLANRVGKFFALRQWSRAKETHDNLPLHHVDRLPTYLSEMLEMPCDDVFLDTVCQRAYNLMYDRSTQENASNALMDVVVEDHAVRSPLDAIAAWRSTYSLTRAVESSLQDTDPESLQKHLSCALQLAPPGSAVELRALAASSVFSSTLRRVCFSRASKAMEAALSPTPAATMQPPYFIDSSTPVSARTDILNCLHCAKTLQILECERDEDNAVAYFCSRDVDTTNANLLSKAAVAYVMRRLPAIARTASADREEVRILPRDFGQEADLLPQRSMEKSLRRYSDSSNDTGYESQDDFTSSRSLDRDVRLSGHESLALASNEFVV
ncbi:Clr6 histone deacetylase associated PHD protein-2 Cph2 [Elasticomyces elasticus]|uniref:Clr6 histone deacetylase associated PHD protein-2 Cph2 n=1 Tax=Exophiala sideris TaxID=1016849 RepID=A0ABR0JBX4_9EURO|nr:Clr6 histone deacetylase associated PHD protein-2 Cph2 [Elasticomyces elasticus]KAK5030587.1 Clr6 histone deacetylase associated PHD protein-2 Cph2 [Exophiala sideris]KAK5038641.1 Clr6 histone deacetylase associated PHD protein-2 Cph2 [Exophiala sideris]KAK5060522.1 Clr6 histone deacetylase associated PHD protein-2 Cph2 [Exophiala sideris]KAK5183434.1 Clr6 histone deacetylase associated PHD protein-2 Cph2 [Eurotiomycetes sp. CCFEE 6388]